MFWILKLLLYIIFGVVLMGVVLKSYKERKLFKELIDMIGFDEVICPSSDEGWVGLSFLFGVCWPFAFFGLACCLPFAWIKWQYENVWGKGKESNEPDRDDDYDSCSGSGNIN